MLEDYAGPVLERETLASLIEAAEVWLRSPRTLTLWLWPVLLWQGPAAWAVAGALAGYLGWALLSPALVTLPVLAVFRFLERIPVLAAYYIVSLSLLGNAGQGAAALAGLAGFIVLYWRLVDRTAAPLLDPLLRRLYPLPVPDQVLRALILRTALRHRLPMPEIQKMERRILDTWNYRKARSGDGTP